MGGGRGILMKILKGETIPTIAYRRGEIMSMVKQMQLGDCIECETAKETQDICVAVRQSGFKPIRRKIANQQYRVWKTTRLD
jgi:hypothetical protein